MEYFEQFVLSLLEKENICFVGSIDAQGFPVIRAMLRPRKHEGVRMLYFSTNAGTAKIAQFQANEKACVYFCNPTRFHGALLKGYMRVVEDKQEKQLVWAEGDEQYYPGGKEGDDYVMLRFEALSGRSYGGDLRTHEFSLSKPT